MQSPPSISLRLFGRPQAASDDRVWPLRAERQHRVLAYLALTGTWVERDDLSQLFWPAHDRALAQANLRKALHLARALPWADALEAQRGALRFVVDCDVHAFDAAAREGRLDDALRLRRGDLLDGFDDDTNAGWSAWLAAERARLAERWRGVARLRLSQLVGAPHESAAIARELLAIDATDEDAVVALMQGQRLLGRVDEQRATFARYAAALAEELAAEPSARVLACMDDVEGDRRAGGDGFVGREREIEELAALLERRECRLLTITGPGGVGKSRLMKEALRRLAPRMAGAAWIPMDDIAEASQVAARLATALGTTPGPGEDAVAAIVKHARTRPSLVVLDNAEHVAGLPRLVERLLDGAPRLRICTTSRARLSLRGEWLLPLAGLEVPAFRDDPSTQIGSEAVRLFTAAASALRPDFDAIAEAGAIARLVRAVDGLPLAILLAANWVRVLRVGHIVGELERSLDVLESADDGEERAEHRSVRATFEQSWRLLDAVEQRSLECLSIFAGTFSLAAARETADASFPVFARLADQSLLQSVDDGRFALHPLIRKFAGERIAAATRRDALARHARWCEGQLADIERAFQARGPKALDAIDVDAENFSAAWRWAVAERESAMLASMATPLLRYFEIRGRALAGLELFGEALVVLETLTGSAAATVLSVIAQLQYRLYRSDDAAATARRALRMSRMSGNRHARTRCLGALGLCALHAGRTEEAKRYFEQSLASARDSHDAQSLVVALGNLGLAEKISGNYERARSLMLEALERQREIGDWVGVATRCNNLAALHQARSEWDAARDYLRQGLDVTEAHAIAFARPHLLINLALVAFFAGDDAEAERVTRQALVEAQEDNNGSVETTALLQLVRLAVRRRELAEARTLVREAIESSIRTGSTVLKLDAVFCFAELLAAEGAAGEAGALIRYYLGRPELEPVDRQIAQSELDRLGPEGTGAGEVKADLDGLLATLGGRSAEQRTNLADARQR